MTLSRVLLLSACVAVAATAGAAQSPPPGIPRDRASWTRGMIHYGKWVTAGAAVGLTVLGAREHAYSREAWDRLLDTCRANNSACAIGADGRYVDATAEYHYQRSLYFDRRANRRILAGQLALLATATMFIVDLKDRADEPENVPFAPLEVTAWPDGGGARLGLRFRF